MHTSAMHTMHTQTLLSCCSLTSACLSSGRCLGKFYLPHHILRHRRNYADASVSGWTNQSYPFAPCVRVSKYGETGQFLFCGSHHHYHMKKMYTCQESTKTLPEASCFQLTPMKEKGLSAFIRSACLAMFEDTTFSISCHPPDSFMWQWPTGANSCRENGMCLRWWEQGWHEKHLQWPVGSSQGWEGGGSGGAGETEEGSRWKKCTVRNLLPVPSHPSGPFQFLNLFVTSSQSP